MTRRMLLTIVAVALVALGVGQVASAQIRYEFKVPFSFVAAGKTFAPGDYALFANDSAAVLTLESKASKGVSVMLPVETRTAGQLAGRPAEVVFDKLNGQLLLSELLGPEEDGYIVLVTKAKHTHERLKGTSTK
jgi:hypothetical protein